MPAADRFTRYLLSLDDASFFALYRNYLGTVETPYNKHKLITEIRDFAKRRSTIDRMIELIDDTDRLVLSAIELLGAPDTQQLYRFLESELDYAAFRSIVLNLKDRLLVIDSLRPDTVELNPMLLPDLRGAGLGPHVLICGRPVDTDGRAAAPAPPWLTSTLGAALYAFLADTSELFTRSGGVRKRVAEALEEAFGELFTESIGRRRLHRAIQTLETLGLVHRHEGTVELRPDSWEELAALPTPWVQALLWAGVLTSSTERAFDIAQLLIQMSRSVPVDRSFTIGELLRLLHLKGSGAPVPFDRESISVLAEIGLLQEQQSDPDAHPESREANSSEASHLQRFRLNPSAPRCLDPDSGDADAVRVQANMEVTVAPGAGFASAFAVASLSRLVRYDVVPTFQLTESSVASARRAGIDEPIERLRSVAGELPQNIAFLLSRWQARSRSVRLLRGLVLSVADEEAEILEHSDEFSGLVIEHLAPGLFHMRDDARAVERLLARLELGAATVVEGERPVDTAAPEYGRLLERVGQPMLTHQQTLFTDLVPSEPDSRGEREADRNRSDRSAAPRRRLRDQLEHRSMSEDVRRELALRIDRKLILFDEQIRPDVIPQFGTEARGLDYLGKIRLIEQAITNGDQLEIITRAGGGEPQRVMVQPREVVESGDDLMLRARQEPDGRAVRIRIRRISLVRRLSGTLLRRSLG